MKRSELETILEWQIKAKKLPKPETEFKAISGRAFRWDFAWPGVMLLVEVNGGTFRKGGHSSGVGLARDYTKRNLAVLCGWQQMDFDGEMVRSGQAIKWLVEFFHGLGVAA